MTEIVAPRKRRPSTIHAPGPMGPIGTPQVNIELRHSNPQMKFRYDDEFFGKRGFRCGSNLSDGQFLGYSSHGGPARILESAFGHRPSFKTSHGWSYHNFIAQDRRSDAVQGNIKDYDWRNKIAKIINSANSGRLFTPTPKVNVPPNVVPRGGAIPQVMARGGNSGPDPFWGHPGQATENGNPVSNASGVISNTPEPKPHTPMPQPGRRVRVSDHHRGYVRQGKNPAYFGRK